MTSILFVDDDNLLCQAASEKFTKEGFTVYIACDGKQALDMALQKHPDVILLDILMPVMDGIAMLRQLRMDPWGKKVPVFILTNLNEKAALEPQLAGMEIKDYLVKTELDLEDIMRKICECLPAASS